MDRKKSIHEVIYEKITGKKINTQKSENNQKNEIVKNEKEISKIEVKNEIKKIEKNPKQICFDIIKEKMTIEQIRFWEKCNNFIFDRFEFNISDLL
jgi:hypothetical protein